MKDFNKNSRNRKPVIRAERTDTSGGLRTDAAGEFREAAERGNNAAVKRFLRHHPRLIDAEIFHYDYIPYTALMAAARGGHTDTVNLLLKIGADIHATNYFGETALSYAVRAGKTETAEFLLDNGARINEGETRSWTHLLAAAWNGHTQMVKLLLERGADPQATDEQGRTALTYLQEVRRKGTQKEKDKYAGVITVLEQWAEAQKQPKPKTPRGPTL